MTAKKKKNITLSELQEILLWQSLNKQLIALKDKGRDIKKADHKALQLFCFKNKMFSKITSASILDETPLSLVSNFKTVSFVTASIPQWKNVLSLLIPNAYILNCDKALADSFDVLSRYDKKFNLTQESSNSESDDEELYQFINQYTRLRQECFIRDFSEIVKETHRLKSIALRKIISKIKSGSTARVTDNLLVIDLSALENTATQIQKIRQIYIGEYCRNAARFLRPGNHVQHRMLRDRVLSFLEKKSVQSNLNKSVEDFTSYEIPLYNKETDLESEYLNEIEHRINSDSIEKINICNTSPFSFLESPLPLV
jgi:hypothetical protein